MTFISRTMNIFNRLYLAALLLCLVAVLSSTPVHAERLKNLADLEGVRANQLVGYGLVVGLGGTGDTGTGYNEQAVRNMLKVLGTQADARTAAERLKLPNVATVIITAELPPFIAEGQRLDVTVSSMANAKSLEGGTLVATSLRGADGEIYAVAQGAVSVAGFVAGGASGTQVKKNHTTVGRIPGGALVERRVEVARMGANIKINLRSPDFTTAVRIAQVIDKAIRPLTAAEKAAIIEAARLAAEEGKGKKGKRRKKKNRKKNKKDAAKKETQTGDETLLANAENSAESDKKHEIVDWYARPLDAGVVEVRIPDAYNRKVPELMALLEALEVTPDIPTRVVINERTGTVVLGQGVRLLPVAIAHGGLTVEVMESSGVSQPGALSKGRTAVTSRSAVRTSEGQGSIAELSKGGSLSDVVRTLNALGLPPRDLVSILQALKHAGALRAELVLQ